MKVILVDDELSAREILKAQLNRYHPDIEIVGEASSAESAQNLLKSCTPDIVFLDVEMPGGSGFELLESLNEIRFHIIFTTAFSEYAIRAIKFSALDYILKPIDRQELADAIRKAETAPRNYTTELFDSVMSNVRATSPQTLILPNRSDYESVRLDDIVCLLGESNYTKFIFRDGTTRMTSKTIKEYEELLEPSGFCRIHKSSIIQLKYVARYKKGDGGEVTLENGEVLKVSRSRKEEFLKAWKS